ncbi:MAG TPA: hypothetical protein VNO70_05700, partial [Blastocatellia bacterium]|nr:hypothetical protein [Blastocatellia bacterium]
ALQQAFGGGAFDAFVAKLNPSGSALDYSTWLGGSGLDSGYGIAAGAMGKAYVMGPTDSLDFPVMNPLQLNHGGGVSDLFIARLRPGPVISDVRLKGQNVILTGSGFERGAVILLGAEEQRTKFKSATTLKGKGVGPKIAPGATVRLRVRNPDGALSAEFEYTRPAG